MAGGGRGGGAASATPVSRTSAAGSGSGGSGTTARDSLAGDLGARSTRASAVVADTEQRQRLETGVAMTFAAIGAEFAPGQPEPVRDTLGLGEEHLPGEAGEPRLELERRRQRVEIETELGGAAAGGHPWAQ